jgi:hypothetical protein
MHPYPHSSELPQAKASLNNATITATRQRKTPTTTSDVEIALACAEVELTKETEAEEKIRRKVIWKVKLAKYAHKPAETEDKQEAYGQYMRQGQFSISKVLPEQKPWIPADQWRTYPRKAHTRKQYNDEGRARWKDEYSASRHIKYDAMYHLAQAKQSALIMSLDTDVGTGTQPKKWLAIILGPELYTYGLCDLPPFEDYATYRGGICYVNEPPARSLIEQVAEIPVVNAVDEVMAEQVAEIPAVNTVHVVMVAQAAETPIVAVTSTPAPVAPSKHEPVSCTTEAAGPVDLLMAAQVAEIPVANTVNEWMTEKDANVDTHDNEIPVTSIMKDIVIFPPYPSESAGDLVEKAWTGRIRASVAPYRLRNQPNNRLIYRRIVQDTNNNNKMIDDSYTMLHTEKYFGRELCAEPRQLEITLFYCEHPQYLARELTETAMAVTGVRANRRNKDRYDLGIR